MKILYVTLSKDPTLVLTNYSHKHGCYAAVFPDVKTKKYVMTLCRWLNFSINPEKLHVTLMYSERPVRSAKVQRNTFNAIPKKIEIWEGKETNVVLLLDSKSLTKEHSRLSKLGAKHSFEEYTPHVTLYSGNITKKIEDKINSANNVIAGKRTLLTFFKQVFSDLK